MSVSLVAHTTVRAWTLAMLLLCVEVAAQESEVLIAASDWASFTGASMDGGGLLVEIATRAFSRAGIRTRIEYMPWKRALDSARAGMYDGLAGASFAPDRARYFHYPQYSFVSKLVLFARRDKPRTYEKLEDLCPATVGVLRGSFVVGLLEAAPCLKLDLADDVITNVRKLVRGRIDLVAESEASVYHYLRKTMPYEAGTVAAVEPALADDPVYIVFSKRHASYIRLGQAYDSTLR